MVGSPNYVRFVYDGDVGLPPEGGGPAGSAEIERTFLDYFASQGLATEPTAFEAAPTMARSSSRASPPEGLFTGAEDLKTAEQAEIYGGVAGSRMTRATTWAVMTWATSTTSRSTR